MKTTQTAKLGNTHLLILIVRTGKKFQPVLLDTTEKCLISSNVNKSVTVFHRKIKQATNESMPHKETAHRAFKYVHWRNQDLTRLRELKILAWKEFKRSITIANRISYKRSNSIFKRECKIAKRNAFAKFTESTNPKTSTKHGKASFHNISQLETSEGGTVSNSNNIANIFAIEWSELAKDSSFSNSFVSNKLNISTSMDYVPEPTAILLESPISQI